MNQIEQEFGNLNPNAPAALSRFAFLVGRWRCEAKVKLANGERQTFRARGSVTTSSAAMQSRTNTG